MIKIGDDNDGDRVSSLYWELALQALAYEDKTEMESRRRRRSSSFRGLDDRMFDPSEEHYVGRRSIVIVSTFKYCTPLPGT
ncbi:hypothetical protein RIF29_19771 [Crotalaria pallida]|uniref:Uncharacterized protein n=1 Tax=Crotalaria pallida TaxID=3830 RepID=A0AAN9F006_CROPI